jgi:CRISPR type III-A-associated protein Csm2
MPDMRDAMRGAGFRGARPQGNRGGGPRSGDAGERGRVENPFPPDYPKYFNGEGHTRVELIKNQAEKIAARFESDGLKRHQLRAFYDHAKRQLQRLAYGVPFGEVHPEIARLKAFAADRAGRANNPIPASFKQFIDHNVDAVNDETSFKKGFMPHFEAVVAYCARIKD